MEPKPTVQNSRLWKFWQGFNYFIGGATFLVGSIILFPIFGEYFKTDEVSAWLYIIGCSTFLIADLTEWLHYTKPNCPYLSISINFFITVIASVFYLVGSVYLIPSLDLVWLGELLFIIGSALIMISQSWKLHRLLNQKDKSVKQSIEENQSGFYMDLFAGLGGFMFFVGTFIHQESVFNPNYLIPAVTIYSIGGAFFFGSALFLQVRYFFEPSSKRDYTQASSVISAQI